MAARYCLHCQTSFGDGTGRAKYCSAKCRKGAFDARGGAGSAPKPARTPAAVAPLVVESQVGELEQALREEIGEVAAATVAGRSALAIARRVDGGEERGSALAALTRQLQALVMECKRGVGAKRDVVDELGDRRARRLGA